MPDPASDLTPLLTPLLTHDPASDPQCSTLPTLTPDIVKTCGQETRTGMVKWINRSFFIQHVDGGMNAVLGRWEIIGNIYETPELIQ